MTNRIKDTIASFLHVRKWQTRTSKTSMTVNVTDEQPSAVNTDTMDVRKFVRVKPEFRAGGETDVPYPRSNHCCATDGINVFMFGGWNPDYPKSSTEMWCFNLSSETWHRVATVGDAPSQTVSMSMLLSGDKLLLFGGISHPRTEDINGDVITFSLKNKTWSSLSCTGERPLGKYEAAMALREGFLYLFGGRRWLSRMPLSYSDLHRLDCRSLEWSQLSETDSNDPKAPSTSMFAYQIAWHEDKLYVVGSAWGKFFALNHSGKIHIYDLNTNKWDVEQAQPCLTAGHCPYGRIEYSLVQWKNGKCQVNTFPVREIYMCGGHAFYQIYNDIWKLELPSLQWSKLPVEMPVPTYGHSAVITPSKCMYIFGGTTRLPKREELPDGTKRTNAVFKIWLALPPLLDMALEIVLSLLPDRSAETIARLPELGMSSNIMKRLQHL